MVRTDSSSTKRFLVPLLLLSSALLMTSFFMLSVNGDEGIIAEHSYWMAKLRFVKSEMFDGMGIGWEFRQYHFHKLFVYLGAVIIKIFGISLFAMRAVSMFFLAVTAWFLYKYSSRFAPEEQRRNVFYMSMLVLIANLAFSEFGIIFRPETMVMALGFSSFYFVVQGIQNSRPVNFSLAALFAGLAAFTHLNGVCFIFAGFLLLLIHKKFKFAIVFGIISSFTALLYFGDILSISEIRSFWFQFTHDPNLDNSDLLNPFIKLINEQSRLFWNPEMALFTVLTLFSLIANFKRLAKNHRSLLYYLLFLIIGLALFSHGKTLKYALLYFPYMALIIGLSVQDLLNSVKAVKIAFILLFSAFFVLNSYSETRNIFLSEHTIARNDTKSRFMPVKNSNILGCESFFFDQFENYHLHIRMAFSLYFEKYLKRKPTESEFYAFAEKGKNIYIIADRLEDTQEFLDLIRFDQLKEGDRVYNYQVIRKMDGFAIFRHIK